MEQTQAEKVHASAKVILCKNGKDYPMSFGAFDREQKAAMSEANSALLEKQILSGENVIVSLVDSSCKQGTICLAQ